MASDEEAASNDLWFIGVVLGLAGSVAINTGNNLQSYGMQRAECIMEQEADEGEGINLCKSKIWVLGTIVFVSGSLLNFASFGFAAQSVLASLEAIQFVTNLIFGYMFLGATISWKQILGTMTICGGTVLAVLFGQQNSVELSIDDMLELYENPGFILYMICVVVLVITLPIIHKRYQHQVDLGRPFRNSSIILQSTYCTWSALFGTLSVVQAKCLSQLVRVAEEEKIWASWFFWSVLIGWLMLVSVWLYRMNEALSKYNPIFIIPLLQVNFIFFAIVSGGIYFKEFDEFTLKQWIGFGGGIVLVFSGLSLLRPDEEDGPDGTKLGHGYDTKERSSSAGTQSEGAYRRDPRRTPPETLKAAAERHRTSSTSSRRLSRSSSIGTIFTDVMDLATGNMEMQAKGNYLVIKHRKAAELEDVGARLKIAIPHITSMATMQMTARNRRSVRKSFQDNASPRLGPEGVDENNPVMMKFIMPSSSNNPASSPKRTPGEATRDRAHSREQQRKQRRLKREKEQAEKKWKKMKKQEEKLLNRSRSNSGGFMGRYRLRGSIGSDSERLNDGDTNEEANSNTDSPGHTNKLLPDMQASKMELGIPAPPDHPPAILVSPASTKHIKVKGK